MNSAMAWQNFDADQNNGGAISIQVSQRLIHINAGSAGCLSCCVCFDDGLKRTWMMA
jgi:hypothetical protein